MDYQYLSTSAYYSTKDLFSLVICGYIGGRCVQLKYPETQFGDLAWA